RAVPKNAPTTAQLHSFHTLARLCLKFYKAGLSSMWTKNSQKCKLDFKGAEEPETKLQTCAGLWRKLESSRKTSTSASLTMQKPLTES
ncbi:Ribonuclease H, partial [Podarcis lilfordi]